VYGINPIIRTLVIRIANYPNRLGPSGKFVENSTKLICLEITCYRIDISLTSSSKSRSQAFPYCNSTTSFYGLKFSCNYQIHIRNYVLIFYSYVNLICSLKITVYRFFSTLNSQCSLFKRKIQLSIFSA
jgi:hypothetical protein